MSLASPTPADYTQAAIVIELAKNTYEHFSNFDPNNVKSEKDFIFGYLLSVYYYNANQSTRTGAVLAIQKEFNYTDEEIAVYVIGG